MTYLTANILMCPPTLDDLNIVPNYLSFVHNISFIVIEHCGPHIRERTAKVCISPFWKLNMHLSSASMVRDSVIDSSTDLIYLQAYNCS